MELAVCPASGRADFSRARGWFRRARAAACPRWVTAPRGKPMYKGARIPLGIRTRVVHGPVPSDHQRRRIRRTVSERERAPVQASCLSRYGGREPKRSPQDVIHRSHAGPRRRTVSRATPGFFSQGLTAQRGVASFPSWRSAVRRVTRIGRGPGANHRDWRVERMREEQSRLGEN
jgi:hypothetical protein